MSLERFFLERGKNTKSETLEYYLNYILARSKSSGASSGCCEHRQCVSWKKHLMWLKLLFRTKELFFYDTSRMRLDQTHKSQLTSLKSFSINRMNELHENERLKACDQKHRKLSLEDIALQYQFFRTEDISEEQSEQRLQDIWNVLDIHYKELPDKERENHQDKTWRLYLARMDKGKCHLKRRK